MPKRVGIIFVAFFALLFLSVAAHAGKQPVTIKVKIEGTVLDGKMLLERLNVNGKDEGVVGRHHMVFEIAEKDYDYRIVFGIEQRPYGVGYGSMNSSMASADVFDKANAELFKFNRQGRASDKGAANAAALEIIKRMLELEKK